MSSLHCREAPKYHTLFEWAKQRVRGVSVRAVEVEDPLEQAVFEVYAHMRLNTPHNSFRNH